MPKISPITLKACIGRGLYHDKEVAGRASVVVARQSVPRNAKRHALLDSRRNVYRECLFALDFAASTALSAGLLNQLSPSLARRTGGDLLDGHAGISPACHPLARAATGIATLRLGAGLCSRAMAGWTALAPCNSNAFLTARGNAFKRNLDHDFEIFAARRTWMKNPIEESPTAETEVETQTAEDFVEIDPAKQVFRGKTRDSGKACGIVLFPLLRIQENRVRLGDLFEAFLGIGFFAAVGMIAERELSEGVLDCRLVGVTRDAENLVIVALCRWNGASPALNQFSLYSASTTRPRGPDPVGRASPLGPTLGCDSRPACEASE